MKIPKEEPKRPTNWLDPEKPLDRLVIGLIYARRNGEPTEKIVQMIRDSSFGDRFPNRDQWLSCNHPAFWATSTRQEETVKRCGRGPRGHWQGRVWVHGPEIARRMTDAEALENRKKISQLFG